MADIVDSIRLLAPSGRQSDALVLLRALYEHMVTFCWVAIDPDRHVDRWMDESWVQRLKLHNGVVAFGVSAHVRGGRVAGEGAQGQRPRDAAAHRAR